MGKNNVKKFEEDKIIPVLFVGEVLHTDSYLAVASCSGNDHRLISALKMYHWYPRQRFGQFAPTPNIVLHTSTERFCMK